MFLAIIAAVCTLAVFAIMIAGNHFAIEDLKDELAAYKREDAKVRAQMANDIWDVRHRMKKAGEELIPGEKER